MRTPKENNGQNTSIFEKTRKYITIQIKLSETLIDTVADGIEGMIAQRAANNNTIKNNL